MHYGQLRKDGYFNNLDHKTKRSLTLSISASTINSFWAACILGVPLTMFMVRYGASGFQLGLLMAAMQFSVIAQLPTSNLLDRISSRKHCWFILGLAHRILWLTPAILPFLPISRPSGIGILIAIIALSSAAGHSSAIPWYSWMADLVPKGISGKFWGLRQSVVMASFVMGAWLSGRILDYYSGANTNNEFIGFSIVFGIAGFMGLADIAVHWFVHEPEYIHSPNTKNPLRQLLTAWQDRDFRFLTLSLGAWLFSMGLTGSFGVVYARHAFNASYSALSAMAVAASLGSLFAGVPIGILIDRSGARIVAIFIMIFAPSIGCIPWFFMPSVSAGSTACLFGGFLLPSWLLILLPFNFIIGGLFSGIGLSQIQLVNTIAPKFGRLIPFAAHWSISGIMSALGPICGGLIMDLFTEHPIPLKTPGGMPFSYFHILLALQACLSALLAAMLLMRVKEKGAGLQKNMIMALLRAGNPLRLLTFIFGFQFLRFSSREDKKE